jgi:hypothetical protein
MNKETGQKSYVGIENERMGRGKGMKKRSETAKD